IANKPPVVAPAKPRLGSIDAYRGLVMFLMMAEVLELRKVAHSLASTQFSKVWDFLAHHQTHVEWAGCSLHDLIQPSFSFLVGVALPFSIASRLALGQSRLRMLAHAFFAGGRAGAAGRISALDVQEGNVLDVRGYVVADRAGVRAAVLARLYQTALAV